MQEMPLFPLNTVLFPSAPLHLQIFEPRYLEMVELCLKERKPFGVSLIQHGVEALGPLPVPHPIGCSAMIFHVHRLGVDRLKLIATGMERIRILSVDRESRPYLVGLVELTPQAEPDPNLTTLLEPTLRRQVYRFLESVVKAGGGQMDIQKLPDDPMKLAYLAAALLQIPPAQKQELLALEKGEDLMLRVQKLYRLELVLLRLMLVNPAENSIGSFSKN